MALVTASVATAPGGCQADTLAIASIAAQAQVQDAWQAQPATAALGEAGRVVLTYGEAPVALVCAPLHICAIEFGPGEEFHDTPSISDSVRWHVEVREGYALGSRRQYLILKPTRSAEHAVLTAFTNRQVLLPSRLVPDPLNYTPVLSFRYPDEELEQVRTRIEEQQAKAKQSRELAESRPRSGHRQDRRRDRQGACRGRRSELRLSDRWQGRIRPPADL